MDRIQISSFKTTLRCYKNIKLSTLAKSATTYKIQNTNAFKAYKKIKLQNLNKLYSSHLYWWKTTAYFNNTHIFYARKVNKVKIKNFHLAGDQNARTFMLKHFFSPCS